MLRVLAALALLVAAMPAPAAAAACEGGFSQTVDLGGTRVYALSERCSFAAGDGTHTVRTLRADVLRLDPSHPNGAAPVVSVVVRSEQVDRPDGTGTLWHDVLVATGSGEVAEAEYRDERLPSGFTRCDASVEVLGFRTSATSMPACWPRGLLLP